MLSHRRDEPQLPQCSGGNEAVMLVFCFGCFFFLLLFRVTGVVESQEQRAAVSLRVFKSFLADCVSGHLTDASGLGCSQRRERDRGE